MGANIKHIKGQFKTPDKLILFYQAWVPDNPRETLVIVHGLGEHSSRYELVARYFAGRGIAVYTYDQRGHGRSQGQKGHIMAFNDYLMDLESFRKDILSNQAPLLLGHSLGGLVAIQFAIEHPDSVKGLIISSPPLKLKLKISWCKTTLLKIINVFHPSFTFLDDVIVTHELSHDIEVCRAYDNDEFTHRYRSARFFVEFLRVCEDTSKYPERLRVPTLFLFGTDDKLISTEEIEKFYAASKAPMKEIRSYQGYYHEILNETGKEAVLKDIEEWIESLIKRPSPESN